jgi:hypothetical protein
MAWMPGPRARWHFDKSDLPIHRPVGETVRLLWAPRGRTLAVYIGDHCELDNPIVNHREAKPVGPKLCGSHLRYPLSVCSDLADRLDCCTENSPNVINHAIDKQKARPTAATQTGRDTLNFVPPSRMWTANPHVVRLRRYPYICILYISVCIASTPPFPLDC